MNVDGEAGGVSTNKWPKRLAIVGAITLVVSIAIFVSYSDDMESATDPSLNNVIALDGGGNEQVNLSKQTSYLLFRLTDVSHNCTVTEVETQTEVTIGSPSWFESDRLGEGDQFYYAIGTFVPDESGPHIIENSAEEGEMLWVVDIMDVETSVVWMTYGGCCGILFGICLLPISLFLWISGRKKGSQAGLVMQTADGMLVPIAPTDGTVQQRVPSTDEVWRSVHGGEILDLTVQQTQPIEQEAPAPFADRPDRVGELTRVVDEIETVDDSTPAEEILRRELGLNKDVENDTENTERSWKTWDEG